MSVPGAGCRVPGAGAGCRCRVPVPGAGCRCRVPVPGAAYEPAVVLAPFMLRARSVRRRPLVATVTCARGSAAW
ncbi:hypothetical protein C6Y14_41380 [Streptomyces dioscori]|uniref:Uncharacterized protein n=1 Tax=Streptomyces dioscori TaxID=2109333 RepID=A0A2P8PUF9_9ACTN|nr:hypothetical protein C6Y14_41380 [Streptomyces dioscori]